MIGYPFVTSITAGIILVLQVALAGMVSGMRGPNSMGEPIGIGDGGKELLSRAIRRHGNLAENSGIFIAGFTLLEISRFSQRLLIGLCTAFIVVRVIHALGLSQPNTINAMRRIGGMGTYLCGLVLGGALVLIGINAVQMVH